MRSRQWISPVNGLAIDWKTGQNPFACGCREVLSIPEVEECACSLLEQPPVEDCIDLLTWAPWLSEVLVGIESPNEDIAANYVRQAAIEFCRASQALQRTLFTDWQPILKIPAWPEEQVCGVKFAWVDDLRCPRALRGVFSLQQKSFTFEPIWYKPCEHTPCLVWYWVAPTEDALRQDRYLYDTYRSLIAERARAKYVRALHYLNTSLMQTVQTETEWRTGVEKVRVQARQYPGGFKVGGGTVL